MFSEDTYASGVWHSKFSHPDKTIISRGPEENDLFSK